MVNLPFVGYWETRFWCWNAFLRRRSTCEWLKSTFCAGQSPNIAPTWWSFPRRNDFALGSWRAMWASDLANTTRPAMWALISGCPGWLVIEPTIANLFLGIMGKMLECADGIHQNVGPKFGSPPPCNFGTGLGLDSERCGFHPWRFFAEEKDGKMVAS